jgi:hypothetical protein
MAVSGEYRGVMRAIMIVSGESKMGQTHSRPRSRRPPDVARVREMVAESNPVSSSAAIRGMTSAPILVDDEDDDVVVSSPRSYAQVGSCNMLVVRMYFVGFQFCS